MAAALYMDVHVPAAISEQLRRRGVDVLTAIEDGRAQAPDDELLARAHELGRVVFTQDIGFLVLAEQWQRQGRPFHGLLFGHQQRGTIGQYVSNLELIAIASDQDDWIGVIDRLPY